VPAAAASPRTPTAEPSPAVDKPEYKLSELTTYELRDCRHALEQAITASGSEQPGSPASAVMQARLDAVIAEQDDRIQLASTRPEPDIVEVRDGLGHTPHLRMALDLLE
jgi:hypothetical protein